MDQKAERPVTDPDSIPVLDDAVDEAGVGGAAQSLDSIVERIAGRLEQELAREFDRLVGDPVLEALSQGLTSYQQQVRSILLRELSERLAQQPPTDPEH